MKFFVITKDTKDFGGQYVVRAHTIAFQAQRTRHVAATAPTYVGDDLTQARLAIAKTMQDVVHLARCENDDPVIVETWAESSAIDWLKTVQRAIEGKFI
jgi:hypothetical protein